MMTNVCVLFFWPTHNRSHVYPAEHDLSIYRPMQSVLTMNAIRKTPKLGSNTFLKSLPERHPTFLASNLTKSMQVEEIDTPRLKPEEVLYAFHHNLSISRIVIMFLSVFCIRSPTGA